MKKRIFLVLMVVIALMLTLPVAVYAQGCEGFLCNIFGSTDRAAIQAQAAADIAQIEQAKTVEVERIQSEAQARIAEAEAQLQREVNAGQIAQTQAEEQAKAFRALIAANTDKAIRQLELEYTQAGTLLTNQTEIALAGIKETGQTERWRIGWDSTGNIVTVVIVGGLIFVFMRSRVQWSKPSVILLPGGRRHGVLPEEVIIRGQESHVINYPARREQ